MLLNDLARTSTAVAGTSARGAKTDLISDLLRRTEPRETGIAVAYLSGELPQRQIGVGWRTLQQVPRPAGAPSLTLTVVDELMDQIKEVSGAGSQQGRRELVDRLMTAATADEQRFLVRLITGELRQGALNGVMVEAIARASEAPAAEVRRAFMLGGSLPVVGAAAMADGVAGLREFRLEVGRPLQPMLAASAPTISDALTKTGTPAALEWKLDGVRVQVHRSGDEIAVFTRTLDDITSRVPELVEAVREPATLSDAVLDGEIIALQPDGRPRPFQETASRVGTHAPAPGEVPLTSFFFDALRLDGADLLDRPLSERHEVLAQAVPSSLRVPRLVTGDVSEAERFFAAAVDRAHEGVVVKSLDAPYAAGRRGSGWIKVKPRHTLDLVIVAVEWGHGRRQGWLSNLHLAARGPDGPVMLGKTFKGLTDEMLTWQTAKLLSLAEGPADEWVVRVRPELVVEIAFDGVQRSTRYPGGMALRFARVLRYREDKTPDEADTIETVEALKDWS